MPRLTKHQHSGNWQIVWTEGRRSRRLSTGTRDKVEAERQLAEFEARRQNPPETFTVDELATAYLRKFEGARWEQNRAWELKAVRAHFGNLPPSLITPAVVDSFIAKRRDAGRKNGTIDKELRQLRAVLNWGVRKQWMDRAPHIETPGGGVPRDRWLTRDEAEKLIEAAEGYLRVFILLGIYTGARTTAILGLTWECVDFDRRLIMYPPHDPRSRKRTAIVPMVDRLLPELRTAQEFSDSEFVVEYRGGPVQSIKKGFAAAVRRAGIDHAAPHDLRHTCATWMVQAGVATARVARFLGDSEKMIEKVYGHHAPDYLDCAVEALSGDGARNLRATA